MVKPNGNKRVSKIDTYLNCAENFAYRSTCLKRKYGAVIVKDDAVISTGYNGSPRGMENCCDIGECPRIRRGMHQGEGYGMCRAVHAEANTLSTAASAAMAVSVLEICKNIGKLISPLVLTKVSELLNGGFSTLYCFGAASVIMIVTTAAIFLIRIKQRCKIT